MAGSKFTFVLLGFAVLGAVGGVVAALAVEPSFTTAPTTTSTSNVPSPAVMTRTYTEDQIRSAHALNERGKALMFAGKFNESAAVFRDASELVPEPKFYFNLATSLFQAGRFDEALAAIRGALSSNPTGEQVERILKLRGKILLECSAQGMTCKE